MTETVNRRYRKKEKQVLMWLLLSAFIAAVGCQTQPTDFGSMTAFGGPPSWTENFPNDSEFYVGIGSAKTGDKSADMESSRARALVNLAASISTQIRSEQTMTAREDSAGNSFQSAEQIINETVNQNIKDVETVDSYYSEEEGYWFYLRLNRAAWRAIQNEEMNRLGRRVVDLIQPDLADDSTTVASRLGTMWKGWSLLVESPYAGVIEAALEGERGVLIDLIERQMIRHIDSLSLRFTPSVISTSPGGSVNFEALARTSISILPGSVALTLSIPGSGFETEIVTGEDGFYSGELVMDGIPPGKTRLQVGVNFSDVGLEIDRIPKRLFLPERDVAVEIRLLNVALGIELPEDSALQNVYATFESLLSRELPVKFVRAGDKDFQIDVTLQFRTAPKNDYDIIIAYAKVFITVSRDGAALFSYESEEIKDGGLSNEQAQARSFEKLIESLETAPELSSSLSKAFSF